MGAGPLESVDHYLFCKARRSAIGVGLILLHVVLRVLAFTETIPIVTTSVEVGQLVMIEWLGVGHLFELSRPEAIRFFSLRW